MSIQDEAREIFPIQGAPHSTGFGDFRPKPVPSDAPEPSPKDSSARDSVPSSPEQPTSGDENLDPLEVVATMKNEPLPKSDAPEKLATVERVSTPKISAPSMPASSTPSKTGQPTPPAAT